MSAVSPRRGSDPPRSHPIRDYPSLLDRFDPEPHLVPVPLREDRMRAVVDGVWDLVRNSGVSWIGFYLKHPVRDEMTLGVCRDKPACSPIGLQGVCGRCWYERRPVVVRDVAALGAAYIACDPRDRSEVVIPLLENDGHCYAVLDADSHEVGSFDVADVIGLTALVEHAGLSAAHEGTPEILRL